MALPFLVVCEAKADFLTSSELADRIFCEFVDWIDPETLDFVREFTAPLGDEPFLTRKRVKALAKESLLLPRGLFDGRPGDLDAQQARRALFSIKSRWQGVAGILLIRDTDGLEDRRRGLEQARAASPLRDRIVIGLAHTKRECWVLAGFEPSDDHERARLATIRQKLGFDPRDQAEQLTAKRVLKHLVQEDPEREAECWKQTPLQLLRDRSGQTGLRQFLAEVEDRLVPLLDPSRRR